MYFDWHYFENKLNVVLGLVQFFKNDSVQCSLVQFFKLFELH
jgi:sensor histidine kinase regulating citrate/malate metabolism